MDDVVLFECWAWLCKRGDDYESNIFDEGQFKKKKKRWITVTNTDLIYSKTTKKSDMKFIQLEDKTAFKTYNKSNQETMIFLVDSQTRNIQVVLEPENFSRDLPPLLAALLSASRNRRRQLTQNSLRNLDIIELTRLLKYYTLTEAVFQDVDFSKYGTPLQYTVHLSGCIECLPHVMNRDAMISCPDSYGMLPIHNAVLTGDLHLLQRLVEVAGWPQERGGAGLSNDVVVNLRTVAANDNGAADNHSFLRVAQRTPLHLSNDEEVTALLLRYGARMEDVDSNGDTPLMRTCAEGLFLPAIELMDNGAAVNQPNWSTGLTPIMLVTKCYRSEQGNLEEDDELKLFKELLDRDANCGAVDNKQMTVLHYACRQGALPICSCLIHAGVDLDLQNSSGATPLCLAASLQCTRDGASSLELCGLLIARGSYPWIRDNRGRQALHYAAGGGNIDTLALLLEISQGQDVNALCFDGCTALDYVNKVLAWLKDYECDEASAKLIFFEEMDLVFSRKDITERKISRKYDRCHAELIKRGALERTNTKVSVEQDCRDMSFSVSKSGGYSVAAATPFAFLRRLTSFLFYSRSDAELLLLTYKAFITPSQLLQLCKIRFFTLTGVPKRTLENCDITAFRLGVSLGTDKLILSQMVVEEEKKIVEKLKDDINNDNSSVLKHHESPLRQKSLVLKRGESTSSSDSSKVIKGVDTSVVTEGEYCIIRNTGLGKIHSGGEESVLSELLSCLEKSFDNVELIFHGLLLRNSGWYLEMMNVSIEQSHHDLASWSCSLISDEVQPCFQVPGVVTSQIAFRVVSLTLRCNPAHKMMRGKALFELDVSIKKNPSIDVEDSMISILKNELCSCFAKLLYIFTCDEKTPTIPFLLPQIGKCSVGNAGNNSPDCALQNFRALQSSLTQVSFQEGEFIKHESQDKGNTDEIVRNASIRAFLQLLTLWCKDFYEDDFESDGGFRIEMGEFVEDIFQICGEIIEKEMDPNCFSPFLGLEKSSEVCSPKAVIVQGQVKKVQQNKRESRAIQQSKRLSSKGIIEAAPQLRGGMYENLYFFGQQSFFDEKGLVSTRTSDFSVLNSSPQIIAEQWTLLEHFLYCRVNRSDFSDKSDHPGGNLMQLKRFQWHMMDWCISQILDSSNIDNARVKISFFLDVSHYMESFRNFNGMFEILTALQTTSVYRLKGAWSSLNFASTEKMEALRRLFSSNDGFSCFRSNFVNLEDIQNKPIMPYLGIYFKDLIHLKQLPTEVPCSNGLINMVKMSSLSAKLLDLHNFQQVGYRFPPNFPVMSSLLSCPKRNTEEDQYQGSLLLAPLDDS